MPIKRPRNRQSRLRHSSIKPNLYTTSPKPDSLDKADEIGSFLSLPCKFGKPFLYEGDPLVVQDKSRKHVKEPRFSEQHLCCLGQITPKL